jgi:hypothetical protein
MTENFEFSKWQMVPSSANGCRQRLRINLHLPESALWHGLL